LAIEIYGKVMSINTFQSAETLKRSQDEIIKKYFTHEFTKNYIKVVKKDRKEASIGCINDIDIFRNSQEMDSGFFVDNARNNDENIIVPVCLAMLNTEEFKKPRIFLTMVKDKNNQLKIKDIIYPKEKESLHHRIKRCLSK